MRVHLGKYGKLREKRRLEEEAKKVNQNSLLTFRKRATIVQQAQFTEGDAQKQVHVSRKIGMWRNTNAIHRIQH
jgi:hypothetical protein